MALRAFCFASAVVLLLCMPSPGLADLQLDLLKEIVVASNAELHVKSLGDGSYRGEEGILRLRPDIARTLGLKVPDYEDYLSAVALYEEADDFSERAERALTAQTNEDHPNEHAQEACVNALQAKRQREAGWKQLMSYRSTLSTDADERLNSDACSGLMGKLILESLEARGYNLRESMALFFNRCQGNPERTGPITEDNVKFVNAVFKEFAERASRSALKRFDLDRMDDRWQAGLRQGWKCPLDGALAQYVAYLEEIIAVQHNNSFPVDPLLFFALVRRESAFDHRAVSYVGAAGLTQIMPRTALDMGMKNVLLPPYLGEAKEHLLLERRLRHKAITLVREIEEDTALSEVKKARELMQKSLKHGRKRAELYARYRKELLQTGNDDRLEPKKAMAFGLKYLTSMLRMHGGDISLALAGYNAGPHRVREYQGIPPYAETVSFRNAVLGHYREYLRKLNEPSCR